MMYNWKCSICGYVSYGEKPPRECPVCHAGLAYFERAADHAVHVAGQKIYDGRYDLGRREVYINARPDMSNDMLAYTCLVCGNTTISQAIPQSCPVCRTAGSIFRVHTKTID